MQKNDSLNGQNALTSDKNAQCLVKFYEAFQKQDYKTMGQCYHTEATFEDPAFGELSQPQVLCMWEMLLSRAQEFTLTCSKPLITSEEGSSEVTASYLFSKTHRKIVNHIFSTFVFKNGKIFKQVDKFDLWKWSRQALGLPAILLGWTPLFQNKIRAEARRNLDTWMNRRK